MAFSTGPQIHVVCGRPLEGSTEEVARTLREEWESVVQDGQWWKRRREQVEFKPEAIRDLESKAHELHASIEGLAERLEGARVGRRDLEDLKARRDLLRMELGDGVDEVEGLVDSHVAICALGSTHRSRFIEQVEGFGMGFVTPVHSSAILSAKSTIGEGTIVSPGVILAAFTNVGRHVLVNRGALLGHDAEIGDYVTIGPGANIAGFSRIGEGTYIGMGAMILDKVSVGAHSVVGAGSVVHKDVPDNVMIAGRPARIIKKDIDGM